MDQNTPVEARTRGFTLIELLVVVAIIALLISVLLPALQGARNRAKQLRCLTNTRSMGEAATFYAFENDDTIVRGESEYSHFVAAMLPRLGYPEYVDKLWRRTSGTPNVEYLLEVCRKVEILQCPHFPQAEQALDYVVNAFPDPYQPLGNDRPGQYTGEGPESAFGDRTLFTKLTRITEVTPADLIYITEAHENMPLPSESGWAELTDLFLSRMIPFGREPRVANDQRHPVGINAVYFDGHAATTPLHKIDLGIGYLRAERVKPFVGRTYPRRD